MIRPHRETQIEKLKIECHEDIGGIGFDAIQRAHLSRPAQNRIADRAWPDRAHIDALEPGHRVPCAFGHAAPVGSRKSEVMHDRNHRARVIGCLERRGHRSAYRTGRAGADFRTDFTVGICEKGLPDKAYYRLSAPDMVPQKVGRSFKARRRTGDLVPQEKVPVADRGERKTILGGRYQFALPWRATASARAAFERQRWRRRAIQCYGLCLWMRVFDMVKSGVASLADRDEKPPVGFRVQRDEPKRRAIGQSSANLGPERLQIEDRFLGNRLISCDLRLRRQLFRP